ncbi:MAG: SRPBCC family protein [Candidatus Rokubacteria bacterium]|nr:SRPBCC family protein [Candidatus Rokubacteria bacterium]
MIRLAIASLLLFLAIGDAREVAARPSLSHTDLTALKAGAILFRAEVPVGRNGSVGMGGTALAYLQSEPETVWDTLLDFSGHAGLFPRVKETRVIERSAGRTLVSYHVAVGPFSFRFFLNNYADAEAHLLRWELDQSRDNDLFRDHWGYWKVDEWEDGALVTYAMGGRTTLPAFLLARAGRDGAVETVKALKARIEGRAGL